MVQRGERRAVLGEESVAGDGEHREAKRHRELAQVRLQLRVRRSDVGLGAAGLLELQHRDGEPVDVQNDVEAALVVTVDQRHLVDGEPIILGRVRTDQPQRRVLLDAVLVSPAETPVAGNDPLVDALVLCDGVLGARGHNVSHRLVQQVQRHRRVQPPQRIEQPRVDDGVTP